jgi:hypothetical protein
LPDRLPKNLIEWLARINQRYLALNQERPTTLAYLSNTAPYWRWLWNISFSFFNYRKTYLKQKGKTK